jgi:hypothetical protein
MRQNKIFIIQDPPGTENKALKRMFWHRTQ